MIKKLYIVFALLSFSIFTYASTFSCKDLLSNASIPDKNSDSLTPLFRELVKGVGDFQRYALQEYGAEAWEDEPSSSEAKLHNDKALAILHQLSEMGPGFEQLLIDSALIQHLDKLEKFQSQVKITDAWEAREKFRKSNLVKQVVVYRALALSDSEVENVLANGLESTLMREENEGIPFRKYFFHSALSGKRSQILLHEKFALTESSPYLSISYYPELCVRVASRYQTHNTKVHLFKIKIPESDLLNIDKANGIWPPGVNYESPHVFDFEQDTVTVPPDRTKESFIFYWIPPSQIEKVPLTKRS